MIELKLAQAGHIKKVLEAIKDIVAEANFNCSTADGFSLNAMGLFKTAGVSLLLRPEDFQRFRCDRNLCMGMNINNMCKMLGFAGNDDIITIKVEEDSDFVTFMFESTKQERIADFDMKLMDVDSVDLDIGDIKYDASFKMPSTEFSRVCKELSSIGDAVVISVTKKDVKFSTRGDIGSVNVVYKQSTANVKPEEATIIQMRTPASRTFSLRYLISFTKATPLSKTVTISLTSSGEPLAAEYKIGKMSCIRFFLAPKLEYEVANGRKLQDEDDVLEDEDEDQDEDEDEDEDMDSKSED